MLQKFKNPLLILTFSYLLVFLVFLFSLVNIWLPEDYVLTGHDSGLALDSKMFLQTRLFAWDERVDFGVDNSPLFGSLTLHFLDYLSSLLAGNPHAGNKINIFFWLGTLFISALIFAYQLKDKLGIYFVYIFPIFIVFNFYIFQSLFILERAKYGILIAILLFLTLSFKVLEKKITPVYASIFSSLIFFVFNGGSILALPLYGGLLVIVFTFLIFLLIKSILFKNFNDLLRITIFLVLTFLGFIVLNCYALLPYANTFFSSDSAFLTNAQILASNKQWVDYISQGSSFINLFRFQGVPDWFTSRYIANLTHSYATNYFQDPILIFFSFLIPIIAFGSLVFIKNNHQRMLISFFGLLTLISMFFVAGTRSPLGFLFEFIYLNVPGFVIFRSPYYKFGSAFVLSLSVLLAFSLSSIILHFSKRDRKMKLLIAGLGIIIVVSGWFTYHQFFFSPNIFYWREEFSTRLNLPNYVEDFRQWSNQKGEFRRTLLVPPLNETWQSDGYEWGYWSFSTLYYALSKQNHLGNTQSLNGQESLLLLDKIYQELLAGNEDKVIKMSERLGVGYFLLRKDVLQDKAWSATLPSQLFEEKLNQFVKIKKEKEFGKWSVYKLEGNQPQLTTTSSLKLVAGSFTADLFDFTEDEDILLENDTEFESISPFLSQTIRSFECLSCPLEEEEIEIGLSWSNVLPNSLLYRVKIWKENQELKNISQQEKLTSYYGLLLKRTADIEAMLRFGVDDKYIIGSLSKINEYIEEIHNILQNSRNPKSDYKLAKQLQYFINTPERKFRDELSPFKIGNKSDKLREEISLVLWNINQLENVFEPLINNRDKWAGEKVYDLVVPDLKFKLLLRKSSLPLQQNSEYIFPNKITIIGQDATTSAQLSEHNKNWFEITTNSLDLGAATLRLSFPTLPNLFQSIRETRTDSPEGIRSCLVGRINSVADERTYRLKFDAAPNQTLHVFLRDPDDLYSKDGYRGWKDEKVLNVESFSRTLQANFKPNSAKDSIFICRKGEDLPIIDNIGASEVFIPHVVGVLNYNENFLTPPIVSYQQIDPTRYLVKIENADDPYILKLNQRFNSNWELKSEDRNEKYEHFPINLYANAWWINKKGDYDLIIEYKAQKLFYIGSAISLVGLFGMVTFLVYRFFKK